MTVFAAVSVLQVDKDDSKSYNKSFCPEHFPADLCHSTIQLI